MVEAVYADRATAPVSPQCRAALELVEAMTLRPESVDRALVDEVRAAGVSDEAIVDAATVSAMFNVIDRLADAFGFDVPDDAAFDVMAGRLLKRGYALPAPVAWFARD